jgi:hypothetical protein
VVVKNPEVEHKVRVQDFERWLELHRAHHWLLRDTSKLSRTTYARWRFSCGKPPEFRHSYRCGCDIRSSSGLYAGIPDASASSQKQQISQFTPKPQSADPDAVSRYVSSSQAQSLRSKPKFGHAGQWQRPSNDFFLGICVTSEGENNICGTYCQQCMPHAL